MSYFLSFLMGVGGVQDKDLLDLGVEIVEKDSDGDRKLKIPAESLPKYFELVKNGLNSGFWNEVVGSEEITFIFKFKDGRTKEYKLNIDNEKEISQLCTEFNNDPIEKTANVYKYISGNKFYHDFMMEHWAEMINSEF